MDTAKGSRTWVLIFEFIVALLVVSFLVVGPEGLDRLTQRIRQYLPRPPAARTSAAPSQPRPATTRTNVHAQPAAIPPRASGVPRANGSQRTLPTPWAQTAPGIRPAPSPSVTQAPRKTPASPTPPPLSPQQYLAKVMRDGHQLYQTGWYGPAMARFKEAARVNPGSASVHLWYGRAAYRAGRLGEARAALEQTIAMAPGTDAAREARFLLERMTVRGE